MSTSERNGNEQGATAVTKKTSRRMAGLDRFREAYGDVDRYRKLLHDHEFSWTSLSPDLDRKAHVFYGDDRQEADNRVIRNFVDVVMQTRVTTLDLEGEFKTNDVEWCKAHPGNRHELKRYALLGNLNFDVVIFRLDSVASIPDDIIAVLSDPKTMIVGAAIAKDLADLASFGYNVEWTPRIVDLHRFSWPLGRRHNYRALRPSKFRPEPKTGMAYASFVSVGIVMKPPRQTSKYKAMPDGANWRVAWYVDEFGSLPSGSNGKIPKWMRPQVLYHWTATLTTDQRKYIVSDAAVPMHVIHGLMQSKCGRKPFDEALAIILEDAWWRQTGRDPKQRNHGEYMRRQRPIAAIPGALRGERKDGAISILDAIRASDMERKRKTLQRRRQRARKSAAKAAALGGEVAATTTFGNGAQSSRPDEDGGEERGSATSGVEPMEDDAVSTRGETGGEGAALAMVVVEPMDVRTGSSRPSEDGGVGASDPGMEMDAETDDVAMEE